uniref:Uncharacterized protein n=1 Tax=Naja naja TaxID=35670 RepID=A0A8C6VPP4_NAJNA
MNVSFLLCTLRAFVPRQIPCVSNHTWPIKNSILFYLNLMTSRGSPATETEILNVQKTSLQSVVGCGTISICLVNGSGISPYEEGAKDKYDEAYNAWGIPPLSWLSILRQSSCAVPCRSYQESWIAVLL